MSTIVLRSVKGSPLSNTEVDTNFSNLNTDKTELGGTYSAGTANGVLFLSSSKVLTTGSALTFDGSTFTNKPATGGAYSRTESTQFSNFVQHFALSGNTGVEYKTTYRFVDTDVGELMRLTSTGLGIGTSSPTSKLEVAGTTATTLATVRATTGLAAFTLANTGGIAGLYIDNSAASSFGKGAYSRNLYSDGAYPLIFWTNDTERMRLDSSGNLGIGTSSPANKLSVNSSASTTVAGFTSTGSAAFIGFGNSGATTFIGNDSTSGNFVIQTPSGGFSTKLTLDNSGNLGLGVTPSAWGSAYRAMQIGVGASYSGGTSLANFLEVGANFFTDGGGVDKYIATTEATKYRQVSGAHSWYTAPSGTANNAISFTQAMTLNASGYLLVGATSQLGGANGLVQVRGGLSLTAASAVNGGYQQIDFAAGAYTKAAIRGYSVSTTDAGELRFYTAPPGDVINERMRLDSSGNLGLGVTPSAWLSSYKAFQLTGGSIQGGTTGLLEVYANSFRDGNGDFIYIASQGASRYAVSDAHRWYIAPSGTAGNAISFTQAMTLDASGNLGVGTTSPTSGWRLDVQAARALSRIQSTTGTQDVIYQMSNTGGNLSLGIDNSTGSNQTGAAYGAYLWSTVNSPMMFATNNAERARIDSSGRLAVGTTDTTAARVTSVGVADNYPAFRAETGATTSQQQIAFVNPNGIVGTITTDGSATLYNITSDQRLKENIQDAAPASALIDSLQVREYDWKSDGSHQRYGFVAQELVTVAPEAVYQPANPDDMMAVDYSKLVPMLVKEIQSLRARLAAANI